MKEPTNYRAIGLSDFLSAQGRKARWVAAQVGISESHLSRIINGERRISASLAGKIAGTVQAPLFLLFELTDVIESITEESEAA